MKKINRITSLLLAVFVAFSMIVVSTSASYAAGGWQLSIENDGKVFVGQNVGYGIWNSSSEEQATVTSVKSSNPKVVKVQKFKVDGGTYYNLTAKKTGKAKLTFKCKLPSGSSKTFKKTVTVKQYPNQIESLKVNGKAVKISGDQRYWYSVKCKKTSATIALKLKDGWKIENVYGNYYKNDKYSKIKNAKKLVAGGKKISFPKKWNGMSFSIEMKKGNDTIYYNVEIYRK